MMLRRGRSSPFCRDRWIQSGHCTVATLLALLSEKRYEAASNDGQHHEKGR
jgi:hypothetical protein